MHRFESDWKACILLTYNSFMEQVELALPGSGRTIAALRFQDLPAEHIIAFMAMPPGMKEQMGVKLLQLAIGRGNADALSGLTFGELEFVMSEWLVLSEESEAHDVDGRGLGLDWNTGL